MTPTTDTPELGPELIRRAQDGDGEALRELAERAYPLVRRWARVQVGDEAEADDLTQDVMVSVLGRLGGFRGSARFTTWLYQVTRHAVLDRARAAARREKAGERWAARAASDPPAAPDHDGRLDRTRRLILVRSFLQELPERQRVVFDLAELQGRSNREVAEMLGIEAVSVRVHLFKARRSIRRRILRAFPQLVENAS